MEKKSEIIDGLHEKLGKKFMERLEKYALKQAKVDFEFHLDENDVKDHEKIFNDIRVITINGCEVEFGIETDIEDKDKVHIQFGYAKLTLPKMALKQAFTDWLRRDILLAKAKK